MMDMFISLLFPSMGDNYQPFTLLLRSTLSLDLLKDVPTPTHFIITGLPPSVKLHVHVPVC